MVSRWRLTKWSRRLPAPSCCCLGETIKHPHPLIYVRGVNSKDLLATMDFLYQGEASVLQENLDSFLAFAEELQLKGLIGKRNKKSMILKWMNSPFPQHKWSILKWLQLFQICLQRDKLQAANKLNLKTVRQLQSLATIMQTWTTLKKQWSRWWRKVKTNTPMENNSLTNAKCVQKKAWLDPSKIILKQITLKESLFHATTVIKHLGPDLQWDNT